MNNPFRVICADCKTVLLKPQKYDIPIYTELFKQLKGACPECGKKLVMDLPIINRDKKD